MPFLHDSRGVNPDEFALLPDGWYPFKIYEAEEMKSSKGHDMVLVKAEVFNDPRYMGFTVWNYVSFIPKDKPGAGISVHFKKCIGVPYGGEDMVDAKDWVGKKFMGKVSTEEYEGKRRNKFKEISPYDETLINHEKQAETAQDEIPF